MVEWRIKAAWSTVEESRHWKGVMEAAGWSAFFNLFWTREAPRKEKRGKQHFWRPEHLRRQSRWDRSDTKVKGNFAMSWTWASELSSSLLRTHRHSCPMLCLHSQLPYSSSQAQSPRKYFTSRAPRRLQGSCRSRLWSDRAFVTQLLRWNGTKTQRTCGNLSHISQEGWNILFALNKECNDPIPVIFQTRATKPQR